MRIRNGRNLASFLFSATSNGGNNGGEKQAGIVPSECCEVNRSPWDVTPLVLAFFHLEHHLIHQRDPFFIIFPELFTTLNQLHFRLLQVSQEGNGERGERYGLDTPPPRMAPAGGRNVEGIPNGQFGEGKSFPNSEDNQPIISPSHNLGIIRSVNYKEGKHPEGRPTTATRKKERVSGDSGETRSRSYCKRKDGKGWRCGKEAKAGSSLCEHHLSQLRSYCSKKPADDNRNFGTDGVDGGAKLGSSSKKGHFPSSSKGEEGDCYYYYYTGFGPTRRDGKRKAGMPAGIANDDGSEDNKGGEINGEDEDGSWKTNRARKRVKCRSLKSLL